MRRERRLAKPVSCGFRARSSVRQVSAQADAAPGLKSGWVDMPELRTTGDRDHERRRSQVLYSYIVKKRIRETFEHVNNHRWDEVLKPVAPNVHHRFAGAHSLGGERHDKETLRRWFERLGRVLPTVHLKVNNIWVKGWPWHTTVFAQWDGTATLLNGNASYFNHGLHVFTLR
jgi:hypothetical protein